MARRKSPDPMPYRLKHPIKYTVAPQIEVDVAKSLVECGYTYRQVSDIVKRSCGTISEWINTVQEDTLLVAVEQIKKRQAAKRHYLSDYLLDSITPQEIEKLNAYQRVLMSCMLLDKARLIEGSSTSNIDIRSLAVQLKADLGQLRETKARLIQAISGPNVQ